MEKTFLALYEEHFSEAYWYVAVKVGNRVDAEYVSGKYSLNQM